MKKILCALFVCSLAAPAAQGGLITAHTADAQIVSREAGDQGSGSLFTQPGVTEMKAGRDSTGSGRNQTVVIPFQLLDLGAVDNPFVTSFLTFNLNSKNAIYTADLYGLAARGAPSVLTSDFYFAAATDPSSDATKLQDSILMPSTTLGAVTSTNIATWLNSQYAGGANVGNYVFLRLSVAAGSGIFDTDNGYTIASANTASNQPFLTYTVPEPTTIGLLGIGGFIILRLRRMKRG